MTTTITAATLTVTLTEAVSLNGYDQGSSNTLTIASITEVSKRIVNVPTSERILLTFAAAQPAAGEFVEADVRYIRITNKDDTNHVTLVFRDEDGAEFAVKLDKGQSFIYNADLSGGIVDTMDANSSALTVALADLVDVTATADTAACDLELFVAGV
tara:strand:- start:4072 stop:4542 length:471 start_codon:yes stop_codon:yes gene_type:complete